MFYQKKNLLEKAVALKRFKYSPLGKELKAETDIAKKKQFQKLDDTFEFDKLITKNPQHLKTIVNQIQYMTLIIVFTNTDKYKTIIKL